MNSLILALSFWAAAAQAQAPLDSGSEIRFHRIHLRNGNFIDGKVTADKPNEVIVMMAAGEMAIRRDQIDRVEVVKMKSYNDKAIILDTPKSKKDDSATPRSGKVVEVNTPEQVKRKVDIMILRVKSATGEREFNAAELQPLGDEGTAYLASKSPTLELKMLDAVAQAVINIKPGPKTVEVLEALLDNSVPAVRAMALTCLVVSGGASEQAKYIRPQLKDKDPRVRETALGMLGAVDDDAWFDAICDLCSDPDKEVRTRALRIGRAIATKHSTQEQFSRVMVGNVRHNDVGVRTDAIAMLGGLGQRESWRQVAPMLDDTESLVRAQAAQTLMILGSPECGDAVVAAMGRERDKWARTYLAGAAQKLLIQKADAPLVAWLSDPDEDIRKLAEVTLKAIFSENFGSDAGKWQTWLQGRPK